MSTYQWAVGHDASGSLVDLVPQPRSDGVNYPERVFATDGTLILKGLGFDTWTIDFLDFADYAALLTAWGLSVTAPSVEMTIKTLDCDYVTFSTYNALVHLPEPRVSVDPDRGKVLNVLFRITQMVKLS